jgi:hypothetical protein
MKKIQDNGFRIVEAPVSHYHRAYGRSQFFNFERIWRTGIDLTRLWFELVVRKEHLSGDIANQHTPNGSAEKTTHAS